MWFKIFKFELTYRINRPATYIYFGILFLMSFLAMSTDVVRIGGGAGLVKENAPVTIATMMGILSAVFMMISSAIMGVAVLRDFEHKMESIIFTNPIKKFDYLAGRFLGSFVVLLFVFSGIWMGFMLGEIMPWRDADKLLPFSAWNYFQPFLVFVVPNLFFTGALFFISGALSRKMVFVYLQWIALFIVYQVTLIITGELDNRSLAAILDPFALSTINNTTQYWTVVEQNSNTIPMEGHVLINRLIWIGLGVITLIIGYFSFSFNVVKSSWFKPKQKIQKAEKFPDVDIPKVTQTFGLAVTLKQLWKNSWFYCKDILNSVVFKAITFFGIFILVLNSFYMGRVFGMNTYPTTYQILQLISGFNLFFLIILVSFSGELIWKEREVKINLIYDAMPVKDFINLLGKFFGMIMLFVFMLAVLMVTGILIQVFKGYYDFDIAVYAKTLFSETLFFLVLYTLLCFFIQVIVNNKFLGYAVIILFFIATGVLSTLGVEHSMFQFAETDLGPYSDMNGYGHYVTSFSWLNIYWLGLAMILFVLATMFSVRGSEALMKIRFKVGKLRLTKPMVTFLMMSVIVFVFSGGFVYYNTNILNTYQNSDAAEDDQAEYEKTLKQYEFLNQPKIVDVNLKVDLYPKRRDYDASGTYILKNKSDEAIEQIHVQQSPGNEITLDSLYFSVDAGIEEDFEKFKYTIYKLKEPLQPGAEIKMHFKTRFVTKGFVASNQNNSVVYNGTFFNSSQFPSLGYNGGFELFTDDDRKDHDLKPKERSMERDDPRGLARDFFGDDSDGIQFEITISTDPEQIAVAPGYLQKEWEENGRKYFHYKMDQKMANFYSIISADYEVVRDKMSIPLDNGSKDIALEIYYHKGHEYNLERMMRSMKNSFTYFSKEFSPYQFTQMRILEFPRYASFAQSFANTVPFSEGIGFVVEIKDEDDVDIAYYVTSHELAHQWWGHQLIPANVRGAAMLSETLSQYSALMVMKHEYSMENMQEFLKEEMNRYLSGRASEQKKEMPVTLVESQNYIHYGKGAVNMFALQDYIGEDSVNMALKRFVRDWNIFVEKERYPTTVDLMGYLRAVMPDSMQYLVTDLFDKIVLFENKTETATYATKSDNKWEVELAINSKKLEADSLGVETKVPNNYWIDIGVYGEDEDGKDKLLYLQKHLIDKEDMTFKIEVDEKPTKAGIDPINKLIDRNPDDNIKKVTEQESS